MMETILWVIGGLILIGWIIQRVEIKMIFGKWRW